MKRVGAIRTLVVGVVLMIAATALGSFPASAAPVSREQAVNFVIARGLAQRGVPYTWGGGDINGPTAGSPAAPVTDAAKVGEAQIGEAPVAEVQIAGTPLAPGVPQVTPAPVATDPVVGFDASGLIQYVYAGIGAKLPRSSGAMYNVGQKVAPAQALPADLIFYGPDGSESVTLFLGKGEMLEVGDKGVTVSPVRAKGMAPYLVRIIA